MVGKSLEGQRSLCTGLDEGGQALERLGWMEVMVKDEVVVELEPSEVEWVW